jgi:hypothetical protein
MRGGSTKHSALMAPMTAAFTADIGHFIAARSLGLELVSVEPFRTDQAGDQDEGTRVRYAEHEGMGPGSRLLPGRRGARAWRPTGTRAYRALSLRARATACCLVDTPSLR